MPQVLLVAVSSLPVLCTTFFMYHHHPSSTMLSSRQLLCTIIIVIAVLSIHSKSINALSPSSRRHLNSNCNDFQDFHASGTQAGKLIQICHDARKKSTRTTTTNNKKAIIVPGRKWIMVHIIR